MSFAKQYKMRGSFVQPRKRVDIREIALAARKIMQLPDGAVDLCNLLDQLSVTFGLDYDVVEDFEMPIPGAEAVCIPERAVIYLPKRSLHLASRNIPRMRFTIFHEIGHFILGHSRSYARGAKIEPKPYVDSEWQADQFAAEITMPLPIILKHQTYTAERVAKLFGVSTEAARHRLNNLRRDGHVPPIQNEQGGRLCWQ